MILGIGPVDALGLEDGVALVGPVLVPLVRPQFLEEPLVPADWMGTVRLGFDVVPEHVLLALAVGPGGLARERARLALDALVQVEHAGPLLLGPGPFVGVVHVTAELPVFHGRHDHAPRSVM